MNTILILAWRNIWRSPTRSMVVVAATALGIWAAMFMTGFTNGMSKSYVRSAVELIYSHIQLHDKRYMEEKNAAYVLDEFNRIEKILKRAPEVAHWAPRLVVNGMIASSQLTRGVTVKGVEPDLEQEVSTLPEKVVEGHFFEEKRKNQLIIGRKLAEKLNARLRSKLILTLQDTSGTITAGAFRVAGIFESGNTPFDEHTVYVKRKDLNAILIGKKELLAAHEIALMLKNTDQIEQLEDHLAAIFPTVQVDTYRELSPDLRLYETQISNISLIYLGIIMLALVFGIINTMLMAVLERVRELGMLMAIGMNKAKVFFMIVFETLLLGLIGGPLGLFLGWMTNWYFSNYGINLSAFSQSLKEFGLSEQVFFELDRAVYIQVPVAVVITALLASIYPALKAIRLRPVDAIRKI